jgi:hypothetical protein
LSTARPAGCHATLPPGAGGAGTSGTGTTVVVVGGGGLVVVVVVFAAGSLFAPAAGTATNPANPTTIAAVVARVRTPNVPRSRLIDPISLPVPRLHGPTSVAGLN